MEKARVWEKIQAFNTERLDPAQFDIFYANSWEVPEEKLGLQYLKDGDVNGATWFEERNKHFYYTFISKENGVGEDSEPMYIDLKKLRPISELRFYAMRHLGSNCPQTTPDNTPYIGPQYFSRYFANKLPSSVTVYGCRENTDSHNWDALSWEELASFEDDPDADYNDRWTYRAATCGGTTIGAHNCNTLEKLQKVPPIYRPLSVDINKQREGFRYLKIKFNNAFNLSSAHERDETTNRIKRYLTLHELEVYADKD